VKDSCLCADLDDDVDAENLLNQDDFDTDDYAPEVSDIVAKKLEKIVGEKLNRDQIKQVRDATKIPSNCKKFQTPKLNNEIWNVLPIKAKLADRKQQDIQRNFSAGLSAFSKIADTMMKVQKGLSPEMKAATKSVIQQCIAGSNAIGMGLRETSNRRRQSIRPYLAPQYANICSSQAETESPSPFLFGDNLAEKLRNSRNVSNLLKYPGGQQRFSGNRSLNFRGPTRGFRGNRGRPYSFQRYFPRRPFSSFRGRNNHSQTQ